MLPTLLEDCHRVAKLNNIVSSAILDLAIAIKLPSHTLTKPIRLGALKRALGVVTLHP